MPVLSARGISKSYGVERLFGDLSVTITRGERVGLLGINGTGKSTLLRILAGLEKPDEGVIERRRDATILYLAQEPDLDPNKSPREIVEEGLREWRAATVEHAAITERIGAGDFDDAALARQSELGERIEQLGGWSRGHVVDDMLGRLGVRDVDRPVGQMSGGERRRVALAHLLVAQPMLAILDEPTNHLDADTIEWLETYLRDEFKGAVLVVTHDRYVLDAICDRTLELDRGALHEHAGGYADFLEQKAERLAHEERKEDNRQNLLRRERAWLARQPQARSTKQKARIQRAEALIADDPIKAKAAVDLTALGVTASKTGRTILDFLDLELRMAGRTLVTGLTLHLVAGERLGIVGPNGAGKTSLLKAILGELAPARGSVVVGEKTRIAMFDQARANLEDDWSILDNVAEIEGAERRGAGYVTIGERTMDMRTYIEQFHFEGSKQRQKVGSLSGGERARVALAKILKSGANLLMLDEPTNDLDIATLSALEELLETWPGCALVVSHDRWFLDRVATSILAFDGNGRAIQYAGNYSSYRTQRPPPTAPVKSEPPKAAPKIAAAAPKKGLTKAEQRELDGIMDAIGEAEGRVAKLEEALGDAKLYTSATGAADAARLRADLGAAKAEVERLTARWEELESRRAAAS
ncbi:MAG: ABC-F family ATP-binding cassette domain-containing protein [Polyangiaceae bacterium]